MKTELLSLAQEVDELYMRIHNDNAVNDTDIKKIHDCLARHYSFEAPRAVGDITTDVDMMLSNGTLHTNHPRHFGLYQPSVTSTGVIADALAAAYNPQLGAWWFSPAANEIEKHCLGFIAGKFGFDHDAVFSCFTTGGSESTTTAVICALTRQFSSYGNEGVAGLGAQPRIYVSEEGHDSIVKIAHQLGIGRNAVARIKTDARQRMDLEVLAGTVEADRKKGARPFLVLGTAGTTSGGVIDPLPELASFCTANDLWLHIDAAWGGGFVFSDATRHCLAGIENADSITWDPHKSLPIPTGAGFFACRHRDVVRDTFHVETTYVPDEVEDNPDLYKYGLQWSRRFIGLKVFMTLAEFGDNVLGQMVAHQFEMGRYLRQGLTEQGWTIDNSSPLPVVCFTRPGTDRSVPEILDRVLTRQKCWISKVRFKNGKSALRACVSSYKTQKKDVDVLIRELNIACG